MFFILLEIEKLFMCLGKFNLYRDGWNNVNGNEILVCKIFIRKKKCIKYELK